LEKRLKTQNQNGPIYLPHRYLPKEMHDLRYIWVSFRGKFQVAEIKSDAQTVHSFYKYMRKIRAKGIKGLERRILILYILYIIAFVNFFYFFSNGVMDGWKLWENGRIFLKKNMEFQVA
jgi:hypothetical protein